MLPKTSIIYKGAFQRIVTSAEMHGFLAMTNQLLFVTNTAEVQSTRMVTITHYQPLALQWAARYCIVATSDQGCAGAEAVSKRKPRKEGA